MKKFLLFAGVLCIVLLVSFQEKKQEPESFAKILKDHPERLQELLKVAEGYKDTGKKSADLLNPEDILSPKELEDFRSKARVRSGDKKKPVIIIATQAINELIKNHLNQDDSLVFFLGEYSIKDQTRVKRYNDRNTRKYNLGKDTLTLQTLEKRTAFAMQVFSMEEKSDQKSKSTSSIFNLSNLFKSSGKGSNDVEMDSDWTNNFKPQKTAVSDVYEFSRLCPPPREGCNLTN